MSKPNPQFPEGKKVTEKRDDAKYQEDKERLEKQEEDSSIPKRSKN